MLGCTAESGMMQQSVRINAGSRGWFMGQPLLLTLYGGACEDNCNFSPES